MLLTRLAFMLLKLMWFSPRPPADGEFRLPSPLLLTLFGPLPAVLAPLLDRAAVAIDGEEVGVATPF